ncbi:MAG: type I DNA topoisomerase [Patescibacteria group bacterium]
MQLVIVESPTKAKTISRFLSKDFKVVSSYGHVRDLPKAEFGVDVDHNFEPKYVTPKNAKKRVSELKKEAKKTKEVILATDEDREGEAISWHLAFVLNLDKEKIKRIVFHEITKSAILEALRNPRKIDINLVNAQQARRILDRIVGYKLSPFLWKKIRYGLSAGRVQSPALRLICEREKEIEEFKPQEFWTIEAKLTKRIKNQELRIKNTFIAKLVKKDDKPLNKFAIKTKNEAKKILKDLENAQYKVIDIKKRKVSRIPPPPFITSTLQQEAAKKFGFSAKKTMMLAQQLYEGIEIEKESTGLITYMRTDSTNLAQAALLECKKVIEQKFGSKYTLAVPRIYKTKSRLAQEAHEAIRPTSLFRFPDQIKPYLTSDQSKLYDLIWKRTVACQIKEAELENTTYDIQAKNYLFRSTGSIIIFDGFTKVYTETSDNGSSYFKETILPLLSKNEILELIKLIPSQHFTEPPARFSEATLIKALEEYGIGRPSTYAPIMSTILERGYVEKIDRRLKPTEIGNLVNSLLVTHFPQIVDFHFTAKMEDDLDKIAQAKIIWHNVLSEFYFPFEKLLSQKEKEVKKYEEKTTKKCPKCGKPIIIKFGRFGKFYSCSNFPECKYTEPLEKSEKPKLLKEKCPQCGASLLIKSGRFGKFVACSKYPECKFTKELSLGIKCPKCHPAGDHSKSDKKGEIVEKRTKTGRIFYSCTNYPKCDYAIWQKPTGKLCPICKNLLVYGKNGTIECLNKKCEYKSENIK